jgi:LmbE family N-acetylglucosaminyl deacetylase
LTVAVLSPHLDDAVLSAWSALRGPEPAAVVNVFDGIPPAGTLSRWDRVTGASDSAERMRERHEEDRAALAIAGCPSTSLGLLEAEYRDRPVDGAELGRALAAAVGDAAEVWAPAGIGAHPDHLLVRDWALAEAGAPVRLYADLPYAVRQGWPAWVTGSEPDPHLDVEAWWQRFMPAGADLAPRVRALDGGEVETKLRAIASYRTQLPGLDHGPLRLLHHPLVIGHEVSWAIGRDGGPP